MYYASQANCVISASGSGPLANADLWSLPAHPNNWLPIPFLRVQITQFPKLFMVKFLLEHQMSKSVILLQPLIMDFLHLLVQRLSPQIGHLLGAGSVPEVEAHLQHLVQRFPYRWLRQVDMPKRHKNQDSTKHLTVCNSFNLAIGSLDCKYSLRKGNVNNIENNSFKNDCSSPATALSNINISSSSYSLASAKATPPENMIGYSTGNGNRMVGSLPGGIPMGMDYITHENLGFQNLANIWSVGDLSSVSMVATPKVGNLTRISEAVKALSAENLNSGKAEKLKKTSEKNQIEFNIQDLDLPSLDVDSVISLNSAGVGLRTLAKLIYTSSETMSKIFLRYFSNPS
ncbi:hypothetical protein PPACK8108_LOCUS6006 [Phakopsora pachyrhizi]|uniref:Uncharacterized protein n=1 Tax=Phakopsora pachyrhizi TaxID=170000 RepID=A0AAV0ARU3_PHAPC|nr:hypothetical protein PPACK8108_LOCUS6006 [Phakopsora pachyrhizi]